MAEREHEALWWPRLRWRLRGATQAPAFVLTLAADAVLLCVLPVSGDTGPGALGAVLLAGFFNLAVVAALAPLGGALLRRRVTGLPAVIARDRAGTALLLATTLVVLAVGLAHRPAADRSRAAFAAQAAQARLVVLRQAPLEYRANIDRMDTWQQGPDLYRTCVPGSRPDRAFCVIVMTDQSPPGVVIDPDQEPNSVLAGPDNPGRKAG
jgi:hypothetical protein